MTYSKEVLKRFRHPKHEGKIYKADSVSNVGNGICQDRLELSLSIKNGRIKNIKYLTYGCPAATSSAEMVCELAKGRTIKAAKNIKLIQILKKLKLPKEKHHCSEMGLKALKEALKKYEKNIHNNNSI